MDLTYVLLDLWRILEVWCIALTFLLPLKKKDSRWARRAVLCIVLGTAAFLALSPLIAQFPFMTCVRSVVFLPGSCSGIVRTFPLIPPYIVPFGPRCWGTF